MSNVFNGEALLLAFRARAVIDPLLNVAMGREGEIGEIQVKAVERLMFENQEEDILEGILPYEMLLLVIRVRTEYQGELPTRGDIQMVLEPSTPPLERSAAAARMMGLLFDLETEALTLCNR